MDNLTREAEVNHFIKKEKNFLWSRAMSLTKRFEDAEDLYQDTVMKVYQGWSRFDPETNFRAWSSRIMLNTHINNATRHKESVSCDFSTGACDNALAVAPNATDSVLNYSDSPEKIFFYTHIDNDLQAALYSLPDSFRVPFTLYHFEGYMYEDISKMLSLPIGTVKSRIFRARKMLKEKVDAPAAAH